MNVTGLAASTLYVWQTRTRCLTAVSDWAALVPFTTPSEPCDTPTGLTTTNITDTQADLNWTTIPGAVSYDVRYKASGSSTFTTSNTVSTTESLSGLVENTDYVWQVRTVCNPIKSNWTDLISFTTTPQTCPTPTGLTSTNIMDSSATLNWDAMPGAVTYQVHYKSSGAPSWNSVVTAATSLGVTASSRGPTIVGKSELIAIHLNQVGQPFNRSPPPLDHALDS